MKNDNATSIQDQEHMDSQIEEVDLEALDEVLGGSLLTAFRPQYSTALVSSILTSASSRLLRTSIFASEQVEWQG